MYVSGVNGWSKLETSALRDLWAKDATDAELRANFPSRSIHAILSKAYTFGFKRGAPPKIEVAVQQRREKKMIAAGVCADCEGRGWTRTRPGDPSSARMTCKACSARRGAYAPTI